MAVPITQAELVARCVDLAKIDPKTYSKVSATTVSDLEQGKQRPQRRKAFTLATALQTSLEALFPLGCDDPNHNKLGKTTPSSHQRGGGRPKGSKNRITPP